MANKIKGLTQEQEENLEEGEVTPAELLAVLDDKRPYAVIETKDGEVLHTYDRPNLTEAVNKALDMADENDLLRDDEEGEDFAASHTTYTRDELLTILLRAHKYEDGEYTVQVVPKS